MFELCCPLMFMGGVPRSKNSVAEPGQPTMDNTADFNKRYTRAMSQHPWIQLGLRKNTSSPSK